MGGGHIDLRQATIPRGEEAVLDIFAVMGGCEIIVPDVLDDCHADRAGDGRGRGQAAAAAAGWRREHRRPGPRRVWCCAGWS